MTRPGPTSYRALVPMPSGRSIVLWLPVRSSAASCSSSPAATVPAGNSTARPSRGSRPRRASTPPAATVAASGSGGTNAQTLPGPPRSTPPARASGNAGAIISRTAASRATPPATRASAGTVPTTSPGPGGGGTDRPPFPAALPAAPAFPAAPLDAGLDRGRLDAGSDAASDAGLDAASDAVLRADGVDPAPAPGLAAVFLGVLTGADASKRPARTPTSPGWPVVPRP